METNRTGGIKMAFITDILNTIKNARKGKDMRQAIYDGIQQCYKDATGHPDSVAAVVERLKIEKGRIDELATSQTFTGNYTQSNLVFHAYRNATTGDPDPDDSYNYEGTSGKHEMPICKIFQEGTLDFAEKQSNEKVKILKEGLYIFELRIFISGSGKLDIEARINDVSQRYNAWQIVAQSTGETKIIAYILYLKGDDVVSFYGTPGLEASVRAPVSDVNCYVLDWIGKAQISDCSKEISDIRVDADGNTYPTAGEAIREQFKNVTKEIQDFEGATLNDAGARGLVPAPEEGMTQHVLTSVGTWEKFVAQWFDDGTGVRIGLGSSYLCDIAQATGKKTGLMGADDKEKLDKYPEYGRLEKTIQGLENKIDAMQQIVTKLVTAPQLVASENNGLQIEYSKEGKDLDS